MVFGKHEPRSLFEKLSCDGVRLTGQAGFAARLDERAAADIRQSTGANRQVNVQWSNAPVIENQH